ncbi:hypothetical protein [Nocardioides terrisoli]|uniref:hypothetical protein n=1 Tax=Nocardioides terrisoli TaxID=3388267 RepID=UPI00287BC1FE|nr:hypothetical protein [Nocardioides marmorisolisilvae]
MDVDDLPEAERLWWVFATSTALARLRRDPTWSYDPAFHLLAHDASGGVRLRMQRIHHGRCVLWGTWPDASPSPLWTGVPGWATSDAVHDWLQRDGASFLAWEHRGEWDTATPEVDLAVPLAPLLDAQVPEALLTAAREGRVAPDDLAGLAGFSDPGGTEADLGEAAAVLSAARDDAPALQGTVRRLLATEIRTQMIAAVERDRVLPQRPVPLVRWARIATPPPDFQYAVHQQDGRLVPALGNSPLAEQHRITLGNLLSRLHREEASAEGGSWLFARVRFDGVNVHFDRAFDSRPQWYEDEGPSLDTLWAEMAGRAPDWRPPWARLLPRS